MCGCNMVVFIIWAVYIMGVCNMVVGGVVIFHIVCCLLVK